MKFKQVARMCNQNEEERLKSYNLNVWWLQTLIIECSHLSPTARTSLPVQRGVGKMSVCFRDSHFWSCFPVDIHPSMAVHIPFSLQTFSSALRESKYVDFTLLWLWPILLWLCNLTFKMWHLLHFQIFPSTPSKALLTIPAPSSILNKIYFQTVSYPGPPLITVPLLNAFPTLLF